ncbi:hypothetical protein MtrunA17_Chr4g0073031 [Medicago truncatula]|uniref:Uncharacterized protein n=1 Tax=Medicago truncatula TaxID=3880 RepID=A0A396IGW8_MEDTR|nr:hypothetical protein MtrunA17_Chr4g0073031 [Medicago truncatula]
MARLMFPRRRVLASSMSSSMMTECGFLRMVSTMRSRTVFPRNWWALESPSPRRCAREITIGLDPDTSSERAAAILFLPILSGPVNINHVSPFDRLLPLPNLH